MPFGGIDEGPYFQIAFSLVCAVSVSCAAVHTVRTVYAGEAVEFVPFYAEQPNRISDVVTNFRMLPERMNPTCSECN